MSLILPKNNPFFKLYQKILFLLITVFSVSICFSQAPITGFDYLGAYGSHHYYKSQSTFTWTNAKAQAALSGGYLASVTTPGENEFIYNQIKIPSVPALNPYITGTVWIGLTDAVTEGNWVWDNGEPVCYLNWEPGEPNNFDNTEDHVQMLPWDGFWNDWFNTESLAIPFIMEIGTPTGPEVSKIQPTCSKPIGTITVVSPAPGAGISYSIDGTDYSNTTGVFEGLAANTYSVTAKDGECISLATSVTLNAVSVPAAPSVTITPPTCSVATGKITVKSPLGLHYSIDGIDYSNTTGVFDGLAPNTYSVTAKDGECISAAFSAIINAAPPSGPLTASPNVLWPPNHKMVLVTIGSNCGTAQCTITGVSVNEEDNTIGDGNTVNDWQLIDGTNTLYLRAERKGPGIGRIYTIHTSCGDVTVSVPHDQRRGSSIGSTEINETNMLNVQALSNPSSNNFKLRITGSTQQKIILSVMDIYGRQVELRQVMQSNGTVQIGDSYRPGIYLISVTQGDQRKQLKLVKQ
jgi:hypothetical protein